METLPTVVGAGSLARADFWVQSWGILLGAARRGVACTSTAQARRWFRAGRHLGFAIRRERALRRLVDDNTEIQ